MSIMRWLRIQWYEPQYNKAKLNAEYHREMATMLGEDKQKKGLSRRHEGRLQHSSNAQLHWEDKAEQLLRKLERARRS